MRANFVAISLCLVVLFQLASASASFHGHEQELDARQRHSSWRVDAARGRLRREVRFCRRWLRGQEPPHSTVATVTTTEVVKGARSTTTVTPTITKKVRTKTTETSTDVSIKTELVAEATTTVYTDQYAQKRQAAIAKPQSVSEFSDAIITPACFQLIYGADHTPVTETVTSTSTRARKVATATADPVKITITKTKTISTVTSTSTTTTKPVEGSTTTVSKSAPTPDIGCENRGIEVAYYPDTNIPNDSCGRIEGETYAHIKGTAPQHKISAGDFETLSIVPATFNAYGLAALPATYFWMNMRTYLFAPYTGDYTFKVEKSDDQVAIWAGDKAANGLWTNANADIYLTCSETGPRTKKIHLTAGSYVPIRAVWKQALHLGLFDLSITDPYGNRIAGKSTAANPLLVKQSCDGTSAPAFRPFGQEVESKK